MMSTSTDHTRTSLLAPRAAKVEVRPSILTVAADDALRERLPDWAEGNQVQLATCDSGERALALMRREAPDLVLIDDDLAPMSALDLLQRIRLSGRWSRIPVIVITSETRPLADWALQAGADDCVAKPIDWSLLSARVSLHLQLRQAKAELERSEERYLMAAQGSRIGLWDWDIAHKQLFLSTRWKEMLGFADHEFAPDLEAWFDRVHPGDRGQFLKLLASRTPGEQARFECELRMLHRDESYRWMQCSGIILTDSHGHPRRLAGSLADITEGKVRDALTGLPNRLLFEERVDRALRRARECQGRCAVLFLDLDKFKPVNDSLGHDAGDLLLCSVSRRLENCIRQSEFVRNGSSECAVARHGGDEFTILIENLQQRSVAEQLAERMIGVLTEPFKLGMHEVSIGASIGIAFNDEGVGLHSDMLRAADTAMYYAKTQGRGCFRVYDPGMQTLAAARLALESDVRHALKEGEFYVVYQPIVLLETGAIDGFEALSRWHNHRGEQVGPDTFIPILESLGLISELGRYVLNVAAMQIDEWNRRLVRERPLTVTINCSTRDFAQPHFQRDLLNSIAEIGVDPRAIRLEVTESTLMENPESVRSMIAELRALGVGVGLDDFGTGFSSLSYLHRLPLNLLKIDKSFVQVMQRGNESYEIVRTIIALARGLSLDVVAEGVETVSQHDLLVELGCTHAQGYLYSRPQTSEVIERLILANWRYGQSAEAITTEFAIPAEDVAALQLAGASSDTSVECVGR